MPKRDLSRRTEFLPRLESLRGLAAVSVVGYHSYGLQSDTFVTGMAPVVLFFVLSGFVLARSLDRNPNPGRFFLNRLFRLLPAAAATIVLLTLLHWRFGFYVGFEGSFDALNVFLNALMIRNDINGVMWSMTVECVASPLILACFLAHKRFGPWPLISLCVILVALSFWGPYVHLLGGFTNLAPLYAFVVGVLVHFASRAERMMLIGCTALAAATLVMCGLRKQTAITILGETLASASLIYLIANNTKDSFFAVLDTFPVRFVGRISYSFYLLHPIGLSLAARASENWVFIFGLAVFLTIPMAWTSWFLIEHSFVKLGRSITTAVPASNYA
ncbi:acyltransferase family protein [Bradyrhizobium commune]|uniref:Acyltransferase n=1 Tax=Bradyrhizobium commune TaxID=83627 RepID=A0A7S9D9Q2_9BRAD|nr:acyltransferase [Bradyrhizobium commune]QPF93789.1 acyltransferase [Bradyrhizobium commune]